MPSIGAHLDIDADGTVVGPHHLRHDVGSLHPVSESLVDEEIIDTPADVPVPGPGHHVPKGVLLRLLVEGPEYVDVAVAQELVDPAPLFRQEPGDGAVGLGPRQVDLFVGRVHVTADYDMPSFCLEPIDGIQEGVVEPHLVVQTVAGGLAVGEVDVEQDEIGVVGDDDPPFPIELIVAEPVGYPPRNPLGVQRHTAVSLLLRGREVGPVSLRVGELRRKLVDRSLGFLEAQDVRAFPGKPVDVALFLDRAEAVDVPREGSNGGHRRNCSGARRASPALDRPAGGVSRIAPPWG